MKLINTIELLSHKKQIYVKANMIIYVAGIIFVIITLILIYAKFTRENNTKSDLEHITIYIFILFLIIINIYTILLFKSKYGLVTS